MIQKLMTMKYALIAQAVTLGLVFLFFNFWQNAKDDVTAAVEKCNQDKLLSIAEAERITREVAQENAARREAALQKQIERESLARQANHAAKVKAERRAAAQAEQLRQMAEDAFNEDELPDSNACLNAYITSRALRCMLHAGDNREAGSGGGAGNSVCADSSGVDGVHPGFSNVTYWDALLYWGGDRDAAIRLNENMAEIRRIQGEIIDGNTE